MNLEIQKIAAFTGGKILPPGARGTVTGISTDSRSVGAGELFVALRGSNFDGHDFLIQAARRGAAACLCEEVVAGFPLPVVRVADTLTALGDLAAGVRTALTGPLAAVTGSSGKTTTKEMLAAILALTGPGLKTEGNFNNLIGLPLTLMRLEPTHGWAVLEMGMSARGEIARLAAIAQPTIGIITNVGEAHLETLHGLDGVARAKGELFAALPAGGTAVINADDQRVAGLPVANGARRILFGVSRDAEVRAEAIEVGGNAVSFRLILPEGTHAVRLPVTGRHNVSNALAAAAAALAIGVAGDIIARGLASFCPCHGRMELVSLAGDVKMIEDTYNANPLSVKAALQTLDEMGGAGRRIAVLGDMLELGSAAADLHCEVGAEAARRCDLLILLGSHAADVARGALKDGLDSKKVFLASNHGEAVALLRGMLQPGDRILVKGSRGMKMETVCAALRSDDGQLAANHS